MYNPTKNADGAVVCLVCQTSLLHCDVILVQVLSCPLLAKEGGVEEGPGNEFDYS